MKQLLISVALMIGLSATAQQKFKSTSMLSGRYSDNMEMYIFGEEKECAIVFTMHKNYITANDKASSTYELIGEGVENITNDFVGIKFDAIDEAGRPVKIELCFWKDRVKMSLNVRYKDFVFIYFVEKVSPNDN